MRWDFWVIFKHCADLQLCQKNFDVSGFNRAMDSVLVPSIWSIQQRLCSFQNLFQEPSRKNTMVEILWIFYGKTPIFAFRSRFSLDDYQCTNFVRSALTQVASSANLLFVCEICQMKIFFLPSVLDVIYELTMFLNIHFLSWEKWRICRYLLPLLLFFFVEPLVSYKNTDTRSWMEFSFICIVF